MKCMCNFCECGKHQCRKLMPSAPPATGNEEPMKDSEYKTQYLQKERPPVEKRGAPLDSLKNDGEFDGMTTNRAVYPKHDAKRPERFSKPEYKKRTSSMDLNTEYLTRYQQRKGDRVPKPGFYRSKTQPYSIGVAKPERSVTQVDFERSKNPGKQGIMRPLNNLANEGDFDSETTNKKTYGPHSASKKVIYKPQDTYRLSSAPFTKDTTTRNTYRPFSNIYRTSPARFNSEFPQNRDEPIERETTSRAAFKKLAFSRHIVGRIPDNYGPPSNDRAFDKTSDDYKGANGKASTPLKRIDNLVQDGTQDFNTTSNSVFKKHDSQRPTRPLWSKVSNIKPSEEPFNQISENHDQFKQQNALPAHRTRPSEGIIIPNDKFTTDSCYKKDFKFDGRPECETDKIIASGYKGYDVHDDFDKKHRFLIKRQESNARMNQPTTENKSSVAFDIEVIHH